MKGIKKSDSSDQNKQYSSNIKKSTSQKIENNMTSGSMKSGDFQSQNSEPNMPDSSRARRDGRKRMKKTISNKVYENMQSQDVSKVDDSNLQQINIDTSINKDNNPHQYNTIDFMSQNRFSEQTMHNEHTHPTQSFVGGAFKIQTGQFANYSQGINQQKNSNLSIQQQMDSNVQSQNQGISQFYAQADGAQMPRRLDNRNPQVIELNQNQNVAPKLSFKQKLCRGIIGLIFVAYLSFNVYMTFQQGSPENGQLRGKGENDGRSENADEYYPHAKEEMRKEIEDLRIFSKYIETCLITRSDFIKQYRKKEFFFNVSTCEWLKTCKTSDKIYSNFCVEECPLTYKDVSGTCMNEIQSVNVLRQCPENNYQLPIPRQSAEDIQLFSCMKCPENCFSCLSQNVCQMCENNYYLQNGQCVNECKNNENTKFAEDFNSRYCLKSNSNIKFSVYYINSKILSKRIFYEVFFSPQKPKDKTKISYIYYINDRNHPTNQIYSNSEAFQQKLEELENFLFVSLPSIPDAVLRDPHFYSFFNQELIPQVENRFQVPLSPSRRLIAGEGYGGFQALYIATNSRPLFEFGFIGLINSFILPSDFEQNLIKELKFENEKITQINFNLKKDLNMKTYIYSDFSGFIENSNAENSFSAIVNQYKEDTSDIDIIFLQAVGECKGIQRKSCVENRYQNFFQGIISYNQKMQEDEKEK